MSKKVIRLNEQDIEKLVRRIIKEESVNEVGTDDFSDVKDAGVKSESTVLRPAIGNLKGIDYIVVVDNDNNVVGYGPKVKGMNRQQICRVSQMLINDWEEEVSMNELDRGDFGNIRPVSFCRN